MPAGEQAPLGPKQGLGNRICEGIETVLEAPFKLIRFIWCAGSCGGWNQGLPRHGITRNTRRHCR